jgi:hypothetical protein
MQPMPVMFKCDKCSSKENSAPFNVTVFGSMFTQVERLQCVLCDKCAVEALASIKAVVPGSSTPN